MKNNREVEVATDRGMLLVPAGDAIDAIPHLAVTMTNFGQFEISHVPSGYRLLGGFERVINAYVSMVQLQLALNELDVDTSVTREKLKEQISKNDKPCKELGDITLRQWIALSVTVGNFCSEFPWENSEEGPHAEFEKLLQRLTEKVAA